MKCVVCGCTDERACDGGCSWAITTPPVCTSCVRRYVLAEIWKLLFCLESAADSPTGWPKFRNAVAADLRELRKLYADVKPDHWDLPAFREICAINRRVCKQFGDTKTEAVSGLDHDQIAKGMGSHRTPQTSRGRGIAQMLGADVSDEQPRGRVPRKAKVRS